MFITRIINGTEMKIELTWHEIFDAYNEADTEYKKEDILSNYEGDEKVITLLKANPDLMDDILYVFDHTLKNHDYYWDCYWDALDYSVKETLKEKGIDLL